MKPGLKILEHTPEDMTVTVEAGMTLAALQTELARHRQWLPLDPPHADRLTIGELINTNASGPRRFGYGTIRDYLIGIKVALADGTIIRSGGKVVKNVAGYDLLKLFVGAQGSLGVVLETTFKLRPLPEAEKFIQARCESLEQADKLIEAVIKSEITPVVMDFSNVECGVRSAESGGTGSKANTFSLVLGFAGTREEVEWQLERARELGFNEPASLDYETAFWSDAADGNAKGKKLEPPHVGSYEIGKLSVLPSRMVEAIRGLNGALFLARAGNGIIYHRGPAMPRKVELPLELMRRVKAAYDPNHILPDLLL
ncbi:MAG: FAD-binding oxidoreductase [Pedosphaera sp.]|nr:FAD-binding oxidoreductase [Pedosphaera sp.]